MINKVIKIVPAICIASTILALFSLIGFIFGLSFANTIGTIAIGGYLFSGLLVLMFDNSDIT